MESGTIVRWLKAEGERVEKGEPLYELDTDKVTQEVEADSAGVLLKIAVREGEVPVGKTIAVVGEEGEDVGSLDDASPGGASPDEADRGNDQSAEKPAEAPAREPEREEGRQAAARAANAEQPEAAQAAPTNGGRIKASPLARRIARERGIDLAALSGTGPEGRIVAEDVERAQQAGAAPAAAPGEVELVPLTSIRKTIARRLTEAWTIPAFQISMSADMTRANEVRAKLVEQHPEEKPTVTDVLAKLCAVALMRHRGINAQYGDDGIRIFPTANVGIAVAAPQGLVVPVLRSVERLPIAEVARARAGAVGRARDAKLTQQDLSDGTFTISNLGMYGVEQFIAVLNPPQAAILAVGATEERAVVVDGNIVARPMMTMTLTCDHRAVDGALASEFLRTVKTLLEEPALAI